METGIHANDRNLGYTFDMPRSSIARRTGIMLVLFGAGTTALAVPACQEATQIDLVLSSNVCLPNETTFAVTVVDPANGPAVEALRPPAEPGGTVTVGLANTFKSCDTTGNFFELGVATIVPTGENRSVLAQIVVGLGGQRADQCREAANNPRCIFARRRMAFVAHQRVKVPIFFDGLRCGGKDCSNADKTCFAGGCVSATADRCSDGTCLTEAEKASGGPRPPDAPIPTDGGYKLDDGATVAPDGAVAADAGIQDVGTGEGSAEASTGMDAAAPPDAATMSCVLGTGLGCADAGFSGNDGAFADGICCTEATTSSFIRSCTSPMDGCRSSPQTFKSCLSTNDCRDNSTHICHVESDQTVGVCGFSVPCNGNNIAGRGSGCAGTPSSFVLCCVAGLQCIKKSMDPSQPGACLTVR